MRSKVGGFGGQSHGSGFFGSGVTPSIGYQVEETYCYCQNISYGDMIACDSEFCKYEWFHFPCVGLTRKPDTNYGG